MQCEILMIGSELLLGQIIDTNAAFMGQTLAENGINLYQKTTVGDNTARITRALSDALERSGVVLTSGGLGPTEDDITRECIAELLGRPLEFRQELYEDLVERFAHFRVPITENNKKQACAPRGATAIANPHGTAPGLLIEDDRGVILCMPGVPGELKPMMTDSVVPYLRRKFNIAATIQSRVLKVCGMGESRVDDAIGDLIVSQANPTIGLLAYPDAVRIRITARAQDEAAANRLIDEVASKIHERLPGRIMGSDDETIEQVVDARLRQKGWDLAVAETATGGMLAQRLVAARAASFAGGLVVATKTSEGPPSPEAARALVKKASETFHASSAIGIAAEVETKTSYVSFLSPEGPVDWTLNMAGTDERTQLRTCISALEHLRRHLQG